jgi:hypothetical protein
MKSQFALHCVAPDGESVTERNDFPSVESAWQRAEDMGSRWIFYPISIVTTAGRAAIIRDVPEWFPEEWKGKRLATLLEAIAANSEHAAEYCNGETPFVIYP